jgi:hypothetical protein
MGWESWVRVSLDDNEKGMFSSGAVISFSSRAERKRKSRVLKEASVARGGIWFVRASDVPKKPS